MFDETRRFTLLRVRVTYDPRMYAVNPNVNRSYQATRIARGGWSTREDFPSIVVVIDRVVAFARNVTIVESSRFISPTATSLTDRARLAVIGLAFIGRDATRAARCRVCSTMWIFTYFDDFAEIVDAEADTQQRTVVQLGDVRDALE